MEGYWALVEGYQNQPRAEAFRLKALGLLDRGLLGLTARPQQQG